MSDTNPGPGVDIHGQPVVDPTKNVETRVEREVVRLDDIANLRAYYSEFVANLRAAHIEKVAALREQHQHQLQDKEAERIDAIRAVDAAAARETASQAESRATTLAGQVQAAAEAARTTVDAARVAASESQAVALAPIQEALAAVQRFQYEAVGQKTQVVETQAKGAGAGLWIGVAVAVVVGLIALAALIVAAGTLVVLLTR